MKKVGRDKSLAKAVWGRLPTALILFLLLIMGTSRMLLTENNILFVLEKKNKENIYYPGGSSMLIMEDDRNSKKPFCQQWSALDEFNRTLQPFDEWYTHHPNLIITNETDTEFCLEPGDTQTQPISNMMKFYVNQFHSPCNLLHKLTMWSSGWSADMWNFQVGLIQGLKNHVPFFMEGFQENFPWHYTANKNDHTNLTCDSGDTTCYFLPYHGCGSVWNISKPASMLTLGSDIKILEGGENQIGGSGISDDLGWSAYLFITRKQLWLRRAVFNTKEQFRQLNAIDAGSDCSVIHVRRGDVAHSASRIYFPVVDYVKAIPQDRLNNPNHYILLMTDDYGAIEEANEFYPELHWAYLNKPRHNGSNAGWEDQMPSRNPAYEVIMLLSELELAMECSTFVHAKSGFSNFILRHLSLLWVMFPFHVLIKMKSTNRNITDVDIVDDGNCTILSMPRDVNGTNMVAANLAAVLMDLRNNKTKSS